MPSTYTFQTKAHWTERRKGEVKPHEELAALAFSAPPEFHGESGFWSPEDLLLAAVVSCFVATFGSIAEASKFPLTALDITADGLVEQSDGGLQFTAIQLKPVLTIKSESDRERGLRLLEKTERGCLIARSLKCKVTMDATIQLATAAGVEAVYAGSKAA